MNKNLKFSNKFLIFCFLIFEQSCFAPKGPDGKEVVDGPAQFTPLVGNWYPRVVDDTENSAVKAIFDQQSSYLKRLPDLNDDIRAMKEIPRVKAPLVGQQQPLPSEDFSDMAALARIDEVKPRLSIDAPRAKEFSEQRVLPLPIPGKEEWPFGDEPPSPGPKPPLARKSKKVADHPKDEKGLKSRAEIDELWKKQLPELVEFGFAHQKALIQNAQDPVSEDLSKPMKNNFDSVDSGISDSGSSLASERDFLASQQTKANDFTFERFKPGESEIRTVGWPKPAPAQLPAAKEVERVVAEKTRKYRVDSYGQFSPVPKKDKSRKSGF